MYITDEGMRRFQEMARVGRAGIYDIYIYSNEGPVPRFHFRNAQTGREGCLKLESADYFSHNRYTATLNAGERRDLARFLRSRKGSSNLTQFQYICILWNDNNTQYPLRMDPYKASAPDYENME